jgi:hypothetical protein
MLTKEQERAVKDNKSMMLSHWKYPLITYFVNLCEAVDDKRLQAIVQYDWFIFGYLIAGREADLISEQQRQKIHDLSQKIIWKEETVRGDNILLKVSHIIAGTEKT